MTKKTLKFTGERLIPALNTGEAFYYEHLARYFFVSQVVKNKIVLDLGCGSGYGSYILKNINHAKKVTGIDISPDAIDYAKKNYGNNIDFQTGNVINLKNIPNKSIDVITCFEVLEHIEKQNQILSEIKRVLKDKGILFISTPNILTYPKGNKYHLKELSPTEFKHLISKFFKNFNMYFQNFFFSEEVINSDYKKPIKISSEKLFQKNTKHFIVKKNIKDSEYLLSVCSNSNLPKLTNLSLSTDKVNDFSLKHGILSLFQKFSNINKTISNYQLGNKKLTKQIISSNLEKKQLQLDLDKIQLDLDKIQSSKTYKIWQKYNKIKKILKYKKND
jgi:2-polyprenyl-3-methyl-5-hydroxy-6-metoxy-1,4-benzoquinol methylase